MTVINDLFISSNDIERDLKDLEDIGARLNLKLSLMGQNIKHIFSQIKNCENMDSAAPYFNLLDKMQTILAELVFKYEIGITGRLRRFVSDFDNLEHSGTYYFEKIKSGEYTF
jgi:hypothetical protein